MGLSSGKYLLGDNTSGTYRLILTIHALATFQLSTINVGSGGAGVCNVTPDVRNDGLSICNIVIDIGNNGVFACSVLMSVRAGYTCVYLKLGLEAGG